MNINEHKPTIIQGITFLYIKLSKPNLEIIQFPTCKFSGAFSKTNDDFC